MFEVAEAYEQILEAVEPARLTPFVRRLIGSYRWRDGAQCRLAARVTVSDLRSHRSVEDRRIESSRVYKGALRTQSQSACSFNVGDAENLPYPNDSFDRQPRISLIRVTRPDPGKAARESGAFKCGGFVATPPRTSVLSWANEYDGCLSWTATMAIDPTVGGPAARVGSYKYAAGYSGLFECSGVTDIDVTGFRAILAASSHRSDGQLWERSLGGEIPPAHS